MWCAGLQSRPLHHRGTVTQETSKVMIVFDIIYNLSLLAVLSVLSNFLDDHIDRNQLTGQVLQGILFGSIALIAMMYPFTYAEGIIFDGRSVVVGIGTVFFGPLTGAISMVMSGVYRVYLGGIEMTMGILTIIFAYIIGWVFHLIKKNNRYQRITALQLLYFGIIVHFMMVVFIYVLPTQYVQDVIRTIGITLILVYPVVTVLIGKILAAHEERRTNIHKLSESEEKFRLLIDSSDDIIFTLNNNLRHTGVYGKWMEPLGMKMDDYLGKTVTQIHGEETGRMQEEQFRKALAGEDVVYEWEDPRPDGTLYFQSKVSAIRRDDGVVIGLVGIARNITETKKMQQQLERSLKEKNVLLTEIHHRVKNNMAIISSLLNLQAGYAKAGETREMLLETVSRVQAMALVHELVYESENFTDIDMKDLLQRLVNLLSRSFKMPDHQIGTSLETDDITLDIGSSIPLALLVNELITNAWKHAFREKKSGQIAVQFRRIDGKFELCVSDDGHGASDKDIEGLKRPASFGYTIILGLVQQLNGTIWYDNRGEGLKVFVKF